MSLSENIQQGNTHQAHNSHDCKLLAIKTLNMPYVQLRKGGRASTSFGIGCLTASIEACGFADFLVRQSARHHRVRICERPAIDPEHVSFPSICIICIVSGCSRTCVVRAAVTKLFTSVLM